MKSRPYKMSGHLFHTTQIPVCLWFQEENKHDAVRRTCSNAASARNPCLPPKT